MVKHIREGDIFYNSQGNLTIIQQVDNSGYRVKLESETGTIWHDDRQNILHRTIQGIYTDYATEKILKSKTIEYQNNRISNETQSTITIDGQSKGNKAIKKQVSSRRIAITSPLIGNSISIGNRRRQIRDIEISQVSIRTRYY